MKFQIADLLAALRPVYLLAEKPGSTGGSSEQYWYLKLDGLHHEHLKTAVAQLRKQKLRSATTKPQQRALKSTGLQNALAKALGAKSYDDWLTREQPKILEFLKLHDLDQPANLIKWASPPFGGALTARELSDRLFNSGKPLPKRIFTGAGSKLLAAQRYGRLDINHLAGENFLDDEQRYAFCMEHAQTVLLRVPYEAAPEEGLTLELTGSSLMLNSVSELITPMYNLLGSNLTEDGFSAPVMRSYNMNDSERAFEMQLFELFRQEIENSSDGWVEVLPLPGNKNLVFLKGPKGTFDWVVRDQRTSALSSNPLYPFFEKNEVPDALDDSQLNAHLYFSRGLWQEKLEHDAEGRHYADGGKVGNWPGYEKLVERELFATTRAMQPRRRASPEKSERFSAHRVDDYELMVSPLVTIDEFTSFAERTGWHNVRLHRAGKAKLEIEPNLGSLNWGDDRSLPVSVTWFDAIGYCRDYQERHGLPIRLLQPEEWQSIAPLPTLDHVEINRVKKLRTELGKDYDKTIHEAANWAVVGGDGRWGRTSSHCHLPDGVLSFAQRLTWANNSQGLAFLSVTGFKEWLSGYQRGYAPVACAASGKIYNGAGLFGDLQPAHLAMRDDGAKVGFRLCYVVGSVTKDVGATS